MDSLFDSIIPLLILLLYLFGSFFRKKTKEENQPTPTEPAYPQPEEHADELRDEIRRRFADRASQFQPEPVLEAPPPVAPSPQSVEQTLLAQRKKLKQTQEKAARIKSGKDAYASSSSRRPDSNFSVSRAVWKRLRSPVATREAIVLMEVLGTPVGIKQLEEEARALANS